MVSHCYIDRYSNYILLHSIPISIQHQQTPLKLHYTLAKLNKSPTFNGFGTQKETLTPSGVRHQIVSQSRKRQTVTLNLWSQSGVSYQPLDYPHLGTNALESLHNRTDWVQVFKFNTSHVFFCFCSIIMQTSLRL